MWVQTQAMVTVVQGSDSDQLSHPALVVWQNLGCNGNQ